MADTNNKYNFLDYEGLSLFWDNVKKVIEDNELVTATALTDLDARVVQLEDTGSNQGAVPNQTIAISYADLKALRDNAQLVPGQQYRIIDYTCTTVQENTRSAGHVFDIIITADSESILNEEARAIQHEGDSYFVNCDLNVWKIWYCLDNDTERFTWADVTNGKGIIYRMIDEFNNDVPYDFKNIQFYRQWDSNTSLWSTVSDDNVGVPCYTFSSVGDSSTTEFTDMSLDIYNRIYSNVIKKLSTDSDNGEQTLNNNCFFGTFCSGNTFEVDSSKNTFGDHCDTNTFGGGYSHNTVGNECMLNTFGGTCYNNTFGNYCYDNTFGNDCHNNTFGNNCYNNSFGNGCSYITLASTSSATTKYEYYRQNHIGDGCQYIVFTGAGTSSLKAQVQNYTFAQGLQGTSRAYLTVNGERSRSYETKVAQNSNGDLKIYCEADLIK